MRSQHVPSDMKKVRPGTERDGDARAHRRRLRMTDAARTIADYEVLDEVSERTVSPVRSWCSPSSSWRWAERAPPLRVLARTVTRLDHPDR
jgi:hypothetical protein